MRKNIPVLIISCLLIVVLGLLAVVLFRGCNEKEQTIVNNIPAPPAPEAPIFVDTVTKATPNSIEISILNELDSLRKENDIQKRIIEECGKKVVVYKYKDRVIQQQTPKSPITVYVPTAPKTTPPPIPTETRISVAPQILDPIFYESGSKNIFFCLRLGGSPDRHWPHLAMLNGENFGNSRNNSQSGYNLEITPDQLTDGYVKGRAAVTKDGTFYVDRDLIDPYLIPSDNGLVELITTITGWSPRAMRISGDFYIYKR